MQSTLFPSAARALAVALLVLGATQAIAAGPVGKDAAQARYRQELALCNSGQSNQAAVVCRREAASALKEARRGGLATPEGSYERNAQQRCAVLEGLDRSACEARMRGEGTTDGSVGGGGILRQSVTLVPGS